MSVGFPGALLRLPRPDEDSPAVDEGALPDGSFLQARAARNGWREGDECTDAGHIDWLLASTAAVRAHGVGVATEELCPPLPPNGNCYVPEIGALQAERAALAWLLQSLQRGARRLAAAQALAFPYSTTVRANVSLRVAPNGRV